MAICGRVDSQRRVVYSGVSYGGPRNLEEEDWRFPSKGAQTVDLGPLWRTRRGDVAGMAVWHTVFYSSSTQCLHLPGR